MSCIHRNWIPAFLSLSLLIVGCSFHGSQFIGKWVNTKNASDTMEIIRNGEQYLLISSDGSKHGATYKDGFLQIPSGMGTTTLTYIKSSDTLIAPGVFGQIEYRRVQQIGIFGGPVTVQSPEGKVNLNASQTYTAADLGTDPYPGAQSTPGGMKMNLPTGSMVMGSFLTSDSKQQVIDFYKGKFGSDTAVMDTADGAIITFAKSKQESVMVTVTANQSRDNGKTQDHHHAYHQHQKDSLKPMEAHFWGVRHPPDALFTPTHLRLTR